MWKDPFEDSRRRGEQERREWYDRMEQQEAEERAEQARHDRAMRARREEEEREEYEIGQIAKEMERQYQEHLAEQDTENPVPAGADTDIIYLWYMRNLADPRCVARPLAHYAPDRFFTWAPGEPAGETPFETEVLTLLETMVMDHGVRWNGTGLASSNVREGKPFATEPSPTLVGTDAEQDSNAPER